MRIEKHKVFRALTGSVVEKLFIDQGAETPEGWFNTQTDALEAFGKPVEAVAPRRGRKPKAQ